MRPLWGAVILVKYDDSFAFQDGMPIFLIWAYNSMSDVQPGQVLQHSFQGIHQVMLITAPGG